MTGSSDARRVQAPRFSPIRVAAIVHTSTVSGPGRQLAALAAALDAQQVRLLVIAVQRHHQARSPYLAHLAVSGVPFVIVEEHAAFDPGLVRRIGRILEGYRPHVVQTHGYKATTVAAMLRLRRPSWRWIGFWHGDTREDLKVRAYHWLDRQLLRRADRIVVMSEEQRASFAGAPVRVQVIDNAVLPHLVTAGREPAATNDSPAAAAWPRRTADGPVLGVVGRLSPEKGVDVFLRAAALLAAEGVPFSALIVGDGPERATLEALRDELGLADRVHFAGAIADVGAVYRAIDLLVLPSRSEGLPNVLLEALANDRPAAATRVGAVPHVIDSPLLGALAPPDDPSALAHAILAALPLADDPAAAIERQRAAVRFSLERRAEEHQVLYASVVEEAAT